MTSRPRPGRQLGRRPAPMGTRASVTGREGREGRGIGARAQQFGTDDTFRDVLFGCLNRLYRIDHGRGAAQARQNTQRAALR